MWTLIFCSWKEHRHSISAFIYFLYWYFISLYCRTVQFIFSPNEQEDVLDNSQPFDVDRWCVVKFDDGHLYDGSLVVCNNVVTSSITLSHDIVTVMYDCHYNSISKFNSSMVGASVSSYLSGKIRTYSHRFPGDCRGEEDSQPNHHLAAWRGNGGSPLST